MKFESKNNVNQTNNNIKHLNLLALSSLIFLFSCAQFKQDKENTPRRDTNQDTKQTQPPIPTKASVGKENIDTSGTIDSAINSNDTLITVIHEDSSRKDSNDIQQTILDSNTIKKPLQKDWQGINENTDKLSSFLNKFATVLTTKELISLLKLPSATHIMTEKILGALLSKSPSPSELEKVSLIIQKKYQEHKQAGSLESETIADYYYSPMIRKINKHLNKEKTEKTTNH